MAAHTPGISSPRSLTMSHWTTISVFRRKAVGFGVVLCISSIKSDTVRLIDAKQNMVGVVSKSEAKSSSSQDNGLQQVHCSRKAEAAVTLEKSKKSKWVVSRLSKQLLCVTGES
ncbi:hypothetical protein ACFX14_003418 [Malus domestica]